MIQGCLLRVHICRVGRSHDVSSSVPARTRTRPSLGRPQIQEPHSGHTNRVLIRPLSAVRWSGRGSISTKTKAGLRHSDPQGEGAAGQTLTIGAVARVDQLRSFCDLVADFAALAAAGLRKVHGNASSHIAFRRMLPYTFSSHYRYRVRAGRRGQGMLELDDSSRNTAEREWEEADRFELQARLAALPRPVEGPARKQFLGWPKKPRQTERPPPPTVSRLNV
jgi:hypothetical protein